MQAQTDSQITPVHIEAMKAVSEGADVYAYGLAHRLREVQRYDSSLIDIGKARAYDGDGTDQMPYFGAILTAKGRAFVGEAS